jgi:hypothetical protein
MERLELVEHQVQAVHQVVQVQVEVVEHRVQVVLQELAEVQVLQE